MALRTLLGVPYAFGPGFVEMVDAQNGQAAVDAALESYPKSIEQIWDPFRYLASDQPKRVAAVAVPDEAVLIDRDEFGTIAWFLMFAERIDPAVALEAVGGGGGDDTIFYELDGTVCMESRYVGDKASDAQEFEAAFEAWDEAMPGTSSVTRDGSTVEVRTCDPGEDAAIDAGGAGTAALALPLTRSAVQTLAIETGYELLRARCLAEAVVEGADVEELAAITWGEVEAQMQADARTICR